LLYIKPNDEAIRVYAVHPKVLEEIYLFTIFSYFDVSSNGKYLAFLNNATETLDIFSVETGEIIKIPMPINLNCVDISISADGTLVSCGGNDIYVFITGGNGWHRLTNWSEKRLVDAWDVPRSSPDGKWLSYFNLADFQFNKNDGLYLTDTACLDHIENCLNYTVGPIFNKVAGLPGNSNSFSWSPDSQRIVLPDYNKLYLLDVITESTVELPLDVNPNSVSWSPVGDVIAYSDNDVYLASLDDNSQERIVENGWLLGWITIPWGFEEGDSYKITAKGSNLNLRNIPFLEGEIVDVLLNGEIITIVGDSIQSDGFSWWKVTTSQGLFGWVVDIPEWYQPIQ